MSAVDFFFARAGYSYDPKTETPEGGRLRCARQLAAAERERLERGWYVTWERDDDPHGWRGSCIGEPEEARDGAVVLCGVLRDEGGGVLGCLGGVLVSSETGTNDPYLRVVEAELALDAIAAEGCGGAP